MSGTIADWKREAEATRRASAERARLNSFARPTMGDLKVESAALRRASAERAKRATSQPAQQAVIGLSRIEARRRHRDTIRSKPLAIGGYAWVVAEKRAGNVKLSTGEYAHPGKPMAEISMVLTPAVGARRGVWVAPNGTARGRRLDLYKAAGLRFEDA